MAIKKVLLSKKIDGIVYDIFPKTSADVVVYGESTVAATLAQFATDLADRYTKEETDEAIKAESTALYNKIMGITEEDGATVTEAYDTLKEVAAWIASHEGDVAAAFANDIAALKTAVGDENSGLIKGLADAVAAIESNDEDIAGLQAAVEALETAVGDANSGLVKAMAEAQAAIQANANAIAANGELIAANTAAIAANGELIAANTAAIESNDEDIAGLQETTGDHETRIVALETTVGDENSGLVKQVAELVERDGCHVEGSETNGNIVVDGEEVVVYTHPETHPATMIVEDDEHQFVTAEEKAAFARTAEVLLVSSQDQVTTEKDLYMVEIG